MLYLVCVKCKVYGTRSDDAAYVCYEYDDVDDYADYGYECAGLYDEVYVWDGSE